uniref:Uncharacterized protein n=1 Tax=Leersia perrieri TaxID=77586 RepID=A0A0D9VN27_9ORYZ
MAIAEHYDKTLSMAGEAAAPSPQMGGCQHVGTFVECNRKKYEQHHSRQFDVRCVSDKSKGKLFGRQKTIIHEVMGSQKPAGVLLRTNKKSFGVLALATTFWIFSRLYLYCGRNMKYLFVLKSGPCIKVIRIEARSFCFKMNHLKHYRDYSGCFISLRDYCSGADLITSVNIMGASVTASLTGTAQFSALAESGRLLILHLIKIHMDCLDDGLCLNELSIDDLEVDLNYDHLPRLLRTAIEVPKSDDLIDKSFLNLAILIQRGVRRKYTDIPADLLHLFSVMSCDAHKYLDLIREHSSLVPPMNGRGLMGRMRDALFSLKTQKYPDYNKVLQKIVFPADWETLIQHYRYLILIHNSRPKPKSGTKKGQAVQMQGIQGAPGQQPVQVQGIQGAPGQQGGIPTTVQALGGSSGAAQGGGQHGQRHKQVGLPRAQGHQGKDKQAPNQRIPKAMVAKSSVSTSSGTPLQSLQAKPQPLPKQQQQQQTPAVRQQKQPAAARKQQKQQPPAVRQQKQPAAARKQQKQQPPAVRQQKQPAAARKQQKQQPPAVRQQKQPAAVRKQQQQQPPPPMPQQLPPPPPAPRWPPLHIGKYNGPNTDPAEEAVRYNRNGREQRTDLHIPQIAIEFMYRVVFPLLLPTLQKALFEAGRFGDLDMPTLIPR